jgi:uncharacterized membrane protein YphA (DoxX/SURF4 family)
MSSRVAAAVRPVLGAPWIRWLALAGLCAPYLQGGINKAADFPRAIAEMEHLGIAPAAPVALVVIVLELGASAMILTGFWRWLGALALAGFTLMATGLALRFWELAPPERVGAANAFFEHLGLAAGLLLVAWQDIRDRTRQA